MGMVFPYATGDGLLNLDDGLGPLEMHVHEETGCAGDYMDVMSGAFTVDYSRPSIEGESTFLTESVDLTAGRLTWSLRPNVSRNVSPSSDFYTFATPRMGWLFDASHFLGRTMIDGSQITVEFTGNTFTDGSLQGSALEWILDPQVLSFDVEFQADGALVLLTLRVTDLESIATPGVESYEITLDVESGIPVRIAATVGGREAEVRLTHFKDGRGPPLPGLGNLSNHSASPRPDAISFQGIQPPDGPTPSNFWALSTAIAEATNRSQGLRAYQDENPSNFIELAAWQEQSDEVTPRQTWSIRWQSDTGGYAVRLQREVTAGQIEQVAILSEAERPPPANPKGPPRQPTIASIGFIIETAMARFNDEVSMRGLTFRTAWTSFQIHLEGPRAQNTTVSANIVPNIEFFHDGSIRQVLAPTEWFRADLRPFVANAVC